MKIPFQRVPNSEDRDPKGPVARPTLVKWWYLATPEPSYVVLLIRVTEVMSKDRIKCGLLSPKTGAEEDGTVEVDLTDRANVWTGFPSTFVHDDIDLKPSDKADRRDHVLMCFTEQWLQKHAPIVASHLDPQTTSKWPWGEGLLGPALAAVKDLEKKLRESNEKLAAMESEFAKLRDERRQLTAMEDKLVAKLRAGRTELEGVESYQELQKLLSR